MCRRIRSILAFGLIVATGATIPAWAQETTRRVSVSTGGGQSNGDSFTPALSADGRFVAFGSFASNLVPGDTNGLTDVFVRDRRTGTTQLVSVRTGGGRGNDSSSNPALSADGRFVTFMSLATNLVPGDTNGTFDVFVHDRQTGTTRRVSGSSSGTQGNGESSLPALSADGRFVTFMSLATNLVPGDTNNARDVFVHDRQTGTTRRVSVSSGGGQANNFSSDAALSADGRFVAFDSDASNLVPGDTNGTFDVFVHDRQTGTTRRVSLRTGGGQGNGSSFDAALSADGRFVAFGSDASNLVPGDTNAATDAFVHDRWTGTTRRVSISSGGSQGNGDSIAPVLSANGRLVAFESIASNLVPNDTNGVFDVFIRDRRTGTTRRVSRRHRRCPGQRHHRRPCRVGGRPRGGIRVSGDQSRAGRHQRPVGRIRPGASAAALKGHSGHSQPDRCGNGPDPGTAGREGGCPPGWMVSRGQVACPKHRPENSREA